jgi:hypothetical protein
MNIERLRELDSFDHLMAVEVEHEDGYRMWVTCRESTMTEVIEQEAAIGYGLSDIDHHAKCDCLASWDEYVFYLDFMRLGQ